MGNLCYIQCIVTWNGRKCLEGTMKIFKSAICDHDKSILWILQFLLCLAFWSSSPAIQPAEQPQLPLKSVRVKDAQHLTRPQPRHNQVQKWHQYELIEVAYSEKRRTSGWFKERSIQDVYNDSCTLAKVSHYKEDWMVQIQWFLRIPSSLHRSVILWVHIVDLTHDLKVDYRYAEPKTKSLKKILSVYNFLYCLYLPISPFF